MYKSWLREGRGSDIKMSEHYNTSAVTTVTIQRNCGVFTCFVVVHPVEHDLWCSVPSGGYIAGHLIFCMSS